MTIFSRQKIFNHQFKRIINELKNVINKKYTYYKKLPKGNTIGFGGGEGTAQEITVCCGVLKNQPSQKMAP